jgi:hypothetical protein
MTVPSPIADIYRLYLKIWFTLKIYEIHHIAVVQVFHASCPC